MTQTLEWSLPLWSPDHCVSPVRSDTQCWLLLELKICPLRHYQAGQPSFLLPVSDYKLKVVLLQSLYRGLLSQRSNPVPPGLWLKWNLYEPPKENPMRMRWKQDRYLWRRGPASISEKIFVSLVCTASPGDTIVQNLRYRAICIYSIPSFSKRIYFYPPDILQFLYPKELCCFGSFPLAALVGNLSEHLSLAADPCLPYSM